MFQIEYLIIIILLSLVILLFGVIVQLNSSSRSINVKYPKNDLDNILSEGNSEVKQIIDQSLNAVAKNVSHQFEVKLEANVAKSINKFNNNLDRSFQASLESYKKMLVDIKKNHNVWLKDASDKMMGESKNLIEETRSSIQAEKEKAVTAVENRLDSILTAYLNKTLEGSINLASQKDFIFQRLEACKEDLIKEIENVN